jgi:hypothetical protein
MNKSILSLVGAVDSLIFLLESDRTSRKKPRAVAARRRLERMRQTLLAEGLRQVKILGNARDTISDVACQLNSHLSAPECSREIEWVMRSLCTEFRLEVDPAPLPSSSSSQGPMLLDPAARRLAEMLTSALLQSGAVPPARIRSSGSKRGAKTAKGKGQVVMRFPDGKIAGV